MDWAVIEPFSRTVREVHIVPLVDTPMHTVPICWCNPTKKNHDRVWYHHAASH